MLRKTVSVGLLRRLALGAFLACLGTFPVAMAYGILVRPPSLAAGWAFLGVAMAFLAIGGILVLIEHITRHHDKRT